MSTMGFEVKYGEQTVTAGIENGLTSVIICHVYHDDLMRLDFGGLDREINMHVRWIIDQRLQVGDKISVSVKQVESSDQPIAKYESRRDEDPVFTDEQLEKQKESELKFYRNLEQRLKEKGLI